MKYSFPLLVILGLQACTTPKERVEDKISGWWRAELIIDSVEDRTVPFFLDIRSVGDHEWIAAVVNGEERILHEDVQFRNDSVIITSPVFNSSINAQINKNELTGYWTDRSRPGNYRLPFRAKYNLDQRFKFENPLRSEINGTWKTVFNPGTERSDTAVALFNTGELTVLHGTFLTETGDYRFLEGGFDGSEMKLSTFDGSHVFLFEADLESDTLRGTFYSGNHWKEGFIAWRDSTVALRDPYSIVELSAPDLALELNLPDIDKRRVDLGDPIFFNKPLIIQIMGSWCPNCMDETVFLSRNYERIRERGVEVLAVAFERQQGEEVLKLLHRYKENLGVPYRILYGGSSAKDSAIRIFPQFRAIPAYPTTIFLNKDHKIVKVHTGFSGPGTGRYFDAQSRKFWETLELIRVPQ
ncbi:MAG: TlpA family protein disulfide reductase [Flavobacteriales bacterium]|nr:TlpA family protein disulfide reductase [Flavobacteriales bacterium]